MVYLFNILKMSNVLIIMVEMHNDGEKCFICIIMYFNLMICEVFI